jgi:hypothetical protein
MGCACLLRAIQTPLRIEPACGQVSENLSERFSDINAKQACDILQQHVAWSHIANDPSDERPDPAVVALALLLAGDARRLARETCSDDIHAAAPC